MRLPTPPTRRPPGGGVASASAPVAAAAVPARAGRGVRTAPRPILSGTRSLAYIPARTVAKAMGEPDASPSNEDKLGGDGKKMADTLSALDALLGVEPEPPKVEEEAKVRGEHFLCVGARGSEGSGRKSARGRGLSPTLSSSSSRFFFFLHLSSSLLAPASPSPPTSCASWPKRKRDARAPPHLPRTTRTPSRKTWPTRWRRWLKQRNARPPRARAMVVGVVVMLLRWSIGRRDGSGGAWVLWGIVWVIPFS